MIESLLKDLSKAEFLENHYLKLPYAQPGGCENLIHRSCWELIEQILGSDDPDVMVVKSGRRFEESRTPSFPEARELFSSGYTLLVRHAERQDRELAEIAKSFARDFLGRVDVHLYATPGDAFGFGWHYDVEDVFILQLEGEKEYSLRKNTVNPWPVLENMPADLRYERELMPMMKCQLAAGDWLYIPHGYWHMGEGKSDAISLAIGVMSQTALDVLDYARERLVHSIRWRQRLPLVTDEPLDDLFAALGEELKSLFADAAFVRRFLETRHEVVNEPKTEN